MAGMVDTATLDHYKEAIGIVVQNIQGRRGHLTQVRVAIIKARVAPGVIIFVGHMTGAKQAGHM